MNADWLVNMPSGVVVVRRVEPVLSVAAWVMEHDDVEHYHAERNHQGLENALITHGLEVGELSWPVPRRKRLGRILSHSCREAA